MEESLRRREDGKTLSQLLKTYERLARRQTEKSYISISSTGRLLRTLQLSELYRKYKKDYGLEKIIEGVYTKGIH